MTESKFLPGTHIQHAWDSTSLGEYKTCPRKYFYTMIEGYRSRGTSVHLTFGIHYHSALEQYDKLTLCGMSHEEAVTTVVQTLFEVTWDREAGTPVDFAHASKTRYNLIRSVVWYLEEFHDDPAKTLVLESGRPAVELSFRFELSRDILLCGHLDRVVRFSDGVYVMDRKTTTATLSPHYFRRYEPDNQMSLYSLAAKIVYNTPVKGVIIDGVQIAVGFSRFLRGFTYRTEGQLEEWITEAEGYIREAQNRAAQMSSPDERLFPMNDKSCQNYGGCQFQMVCSRDPRVRKGLLESNFERKEWNPLQQR